MELGATTPSMAAGLLAIVLLAPIGCAPTSRFHLTNNTDPAVQALPLAYRPNDKVTTRRDWPGLLEHMVTVPAGTVHLFETPLHTSHDRVGLAIAGPGIQPSLWGYTIVMLRSRNASLLLEHPENGVVLRQTDPGPTRSLPLPQGPFWITPIAMAPAAEGRSSDAR